MGSRSVVVLCAIANAITHQAAGVALRDPANCERADARGLPLGRQAGFTRRLTPEGALRSNARHGCAPLSLLPAFNLS